MEIVLSTVGFIIVFSIGTLGWLLWVLDKLYRAETRRHKTTADQLQELRRTLELERSSWTKHFEDTDVLIQEMQDRIDDARTALTASIKLREQAEEDLALAIIDRDKARASEQGKANRLHVFELAVKKAVEKLGRCGFTDDHNRLLDMTPEWIKLTRAVKEK